MTVPPAISRGVVKNTVTKMVRNSSQSRFFSAAARVATLVFISAIIDCITFDNSMERLVKHNRGNTGNEQETRPGIIFTSKKSNNQKEYQESANGFHGSSLSVYIRVTSD